MLEKLGAIKRANKEAFAAHAKKTRGVEINPDAIFDVQVKRLHEYKRQLLNVLHIIALYQRLQDDPNAITQPHTFLFGAKAAPGYAVAKRIIRLINSLADQIDHDPICRDKLQVVFLENYRVSLAEQLMPASEVSQQISTAGKEASGTGNMKFMMNGALTVGTLDGANVEMHDLLGDENMFLFGLRADEVEQLKREGYVPQRLYNRDPGPPPLPGRPAQRLPGRRPLRRPVPAAAVRRRRQPGGRVFPAGGLCSLLPGGAAHGGDLSGPDGLEPHEPPQHRPQRRVRRRPGRGGVRRPHLARAPQVILRLTPRERLDRCSRGVFSDAGPRRRKKICIL